MSRYFIVWVSFGILSPFLLPVGAIECSEKETLLKRMPSTVTQLTDCLMECTGMTYIKKLQLQDSHNIRLKDSTEGDLGEYCWSTELKCTVGESFRHAFVVLPVDVSSVGHEMLEVKATAPTNTTLLAHKSPSTIADNCGLRYDVTQHFSAEQAGASFCIQVTAQEDVLGDKVLKCPPYLVTFWQRNPSQSNQEGGNDIVPPGGYYMILQRDETAVLHTIQPLDGTLVTGQCGVFCPLKLLTVVSYEEDICVLII